MVKLTETAMTILKERYLLEGESEWGHLTARVAKCIAKSDDEYVRFKEVMDAQDFIPNSPMLMNAGTKIKSYHACNVLGVEDDISSIFKYYSDAAILSKAGGGVGVNWSKVRAEGTKVGDTNGVASGPISFMQIQDVATEVIKQGGRRKGANIFILDADHPDIYKFIAAKDSDGVLENANLSVRVSDDFMNKALDPVAYFPEKKLWKELTSRAHSSAEPGILFGDAIERANVTPKLGELNSVNPCGEISLLPNEICCLGSINLSNHVVNGKVDWHKLGSTTNTAVLFLNRILDASEYPLPETKVAMGLSRKIGLGFMGLHDMLIKLGIPYDSEEGRRVAKDVANCITTDGKEYSEMMGDEEGYYGCWEEGMPKRRNANISMIAPTGTLSTFANVSSGIEPYYAPYYERDNIGQVFKMYCQPLLDMAEELGITEAEVLDEYPELFKSAEEISGEAHVLMQAAVQSELCNNISKTINLPSTATVEEVRHLYELAWKEGCKGVTVYVDGSRGAGVLSSKDISNDSGDGGTIEEAQQASAPCTKADIPDQLHAVRYKIKVKKETVYVMVAEDNSGSPVEVFCKFPYAQDNDWDSLCRSLSLSLRYGVPLDDVVRQLEKSVRVLNDTPSHLARILKGYLKDGDVVCGECGGKVIFTEGCEKCLSCGISKCG